MVVVFRAQSAIGNHYVLAMPSRLITFLRHWKRQCFRIDVSKQICARLLPDSTDMSSPESGHVSNAQKAWRFGSETTPWSCSLQCCESCFIYSNHDFLICGFFLRGMICDRFPVITWEPGRLQSRLLGQLFCLVLSSLLTYSYASSHHYSR